MIVYCLDFEKLKERKGKEKGIVIDRVYSDLLLTK